MPHNPWVAVTSCWWLQLGIPVPPGCIKHRWLKNHGWTWLQVLNVVAAITNLLFYDVPANLLFHEAHGLATEKIAMRDGTPRRGLHGVEIRAGSLVESLIFQYHTNKSIKLRSEYHTFNSPLPTIVPAILFAIASNYLNGL